MPVEQSQPANNETATAVAQHADISTAARQFQTFIRFLHESEEACDTKSSVRTRV
jgi:hypothetical protein